MHDPRAETRNSVVEKIHIRETMPGDLGHPHDHDQASWTIQMSVRAGLLPPDIYTYIFTSQQDANDFLNRYPIGTQLGRTALRSAEEKVEARRYIETYLDSDKVCVTRPIGDFNSPLAYEILRKAGIEDYRGLCSEVIDYLGETRISHLKSKYAENWEVIGAFEYCWVQLSHSSAAFVAAFFHYHYYITQNDMMAGYLWRDLEVLAHDVEIDALSVQAMRKNAGAKGSERSKRARERRRAELLKSMESTVERNPDVARLGMEAVAKLALEASIEESPELWTQGKRQISEYLGEIQRGEAGDAMQARLAAILSA